MIHISPSYPLSPIPYPLSPILEHDAVRDALDAAKHVFLDVPQLSHGDTSAPQRLRLPRAPLLDLCEAGWVLPRGRVVGQEPHQSRVPDARGGRCSREGRA